MVAEDTGLPLPLGGNAVRRDLGPAVIAQIARDLRASIVYALEHRRRPGPRQAIQPRNRRRADRYLRGDVREPMDGGLRPTGARGGADTSTGAIAAGIIPERVAVEFVG